MTTTLTKTETATLTFDARNLARGWLSVALAASKDKDRPILNRTVNIEALDTGVRLIATDGYMILHSWVPSIGNEWPLTVPDIDEAPAVTAIAQDAHGRAKNLLWHLLNLTADEDAPSIEVDLVVGDTSHDDTNAMPTFAGMSRTWVTIAVPDRERLKLPTIDGEFPAWRPLLDAFTSKTAKTIALAPEIIGRLAQLERTTGKTSLLWEFGGVEKAARVRVHEAEPPVEGLVMPQRVDWGAKGDE